MCNCMIQALSKVPLGISVEPIPFNKQFTDECHDKEEGPQLSKETFLLRIFGNIHAVKSYLNKYQDLQKIFEKMLASKPAFFNSQQELKLRNFLIVTDLPFQIIHHYHLDESPLSKDLLGLVRVRKECVQLIFQCLGPNEFQKEFTAEELVQLELTCWKHHCMIKKKPKENIKRISWIDAMKSWGCQAQPHADLVNMLLLLFKFYPVDLQRIKMVNPPKEIFDPTGVPIKRAFSRNFTLWERHCFRTYIINESLNTLENDFCLPLNPQEKEILIECFSDHEVLATFNFILIELEKRLNATDFLPKTTWNEIAAMIDHQMKDQKCKIIIRNIALLQIIQQWIFLYYPTELNFSILMELIRGTSDDDKNSMIGMLRIPKSPYAAFVCWGPLLQEIYKIYHFKPKDALLAIPSLCLLRPDYVEAVTKIVIALENFFGAPLRPALILQLYCEPPVSPDILRILTKLLIYKESLGCDDFFAQEITFVLFYKLFPELCVSLNGRETFSEIIKACTLTPLTFLNVIERAPFLIEIPVSLANLKNTFYPLAGSFDEGPLAIHSWHTKKNVFHFESSYLLCPEALTLRTVDVPLNIDYELFDEKFCKMFNFLMPAFFNNHFFFQPKDGWERFDAMENFLLEMSEASLLLSCWKEYKSLMLEQIDLNDPQLLQMFSETAPFFKRLLPRSIVTYSEMQSTLSSMHNGTRLVETLKTYKSSKQQQLDQVTQGLVNFLSTVKIELRRILSEFNKAEKTFPVEDKGWSLLDPKHPNHLKSEYCIYKTDYQAIVEGLCQPSLEPNQFQLQLFHYGSPLEVTVSVHKPVEGAYLFRILKEPYACSYEVKFPQDVFPKLKECLIYSALLLLKARFYRMTS